MVVIEHSRSVPERVSSVSGSSAMQHDFPFTPRMTPCTAEVAKTKKPSLGEDLQQVLVGLLLAGTFHCESQHSSMPTVQPNYSMTTRKISGSEEVLEDPRSV